MESMNSGELLKLLQSMGQGGASLPSLNEGQFRAFMAQAAVSAVAALERTSDTDRRLVEALERSVEVATSDLEPEPQGRSEQLGL